MARSSKVSPRGGFAEPHGRTEVLVPMERCCRRRRSPWPGWLGAVVLVVLGWASAHRAWCEPRGDFDPLIQQPPVSARAEVARGSRLVPGVVAPDLRVVVRNVTRDLGWRHAPQAVVVRAVSWADHPSDPRPWHRRLFGQTTVQADGTVVHDTTVPGLTHLAFESGLLFPGEELAVVVPMAPQARRARLLVYLAEVADEEKWASEIMVPEVLVSQERPPTHVTWLPAGPAQVEGRRGQGGFGIVRASAHPGAPPLTLRSLIIPVELPLTADPKGMRTGGLSRDQAVRMAGQGRKGDFHAVYRPSLSAWFVVAADGSGTALQREGKAWRRRALPRMAPTVPEELGHGAGGGTQMLLLPSAFGDLLPVHIPRQTVGGFEEGLTLVPAGQLWRMLERALERNVEIRRVRCDPDGKGSTDIISAGVDVDASGLWINP